MAIKTFLFRSLCKFPLVQLFLSIILSLTVLSAAVAQQQETSQSTQTNDRYVTIDFNDVDIGVFIKFISELTEKNFVVDQRVKGKVTIISPGKITVKEAYKVFESVLEVHGFAAVDAGEITKIIPAPTARTMNVETRFKENPASPEDKIVTQLIRLQYADPEDLKRLITPLVSKSSVVLGYQPTNTLIVTDIYSNITRLLGIIKAIDVEGVGQELAVIPLKYSVASKFVTLLTTVFQTQKGGRKPGVETTVKFVADERTNTVVVMASEVDMVRIKKLIDILDKETPREKGKIHVYYLENATAEELAKVLQELPTKEEAAGAKIREAPVISEKVRISADKATNSLIITAEQSEYGVIENIIKKLDIPRAMVYIESLIMEVNVTKELNLGTEWLVGGDTDIAGKDVNYGVGSGTGGPLTGIFQPSVTGVPNFPAGFSVGLIGEMIKVGDLVFPNLSAFVNAMKKDKDVHILSTPQILTTDNQEASIVVGKNVPFQTQSAAQNATDTYSSFEYRDVGITLKITPHISKDRFVRLNVAQEVTRLDQAGTTSQDRPTTLKRAIDTTIIVKDKSTVVLGGLIDDQFSDTENSVPCLGNIPVLGWAFKSSNRGNDKTNLYVFLTPRVIENPVEAGDVYSQKKSEIDSVREAQIKMYKERGIDVHQ